MKRFIFALFVCGYISCFSQQIDKDNSTIRWEASSVAKKHYGNIKFKSGGFLLKDGEIKGGKIIIDLTTITCLDIESEKYNKMFLDHIKSDDFFDVSKYPSCKFEIEKVVKSNMIGKLTIKGITQDITIPIKYSLENNVLKLSGSVDIDRTKFKIIYGSGSFFKSLGDKMIKDNFNIKFNIVAK